MIKILEQKNYIVVCPCCESKLSYTKEDTEVRQTGMNEYERIVKCPVCENEIKVEW